MTIPMLMLCSLACGTPHHNGSSGPAIRPAAQPSTLAAAPPPEAEAGDRPDRFQCGTNDDCALDCELGAVSLAWRTQLAPRIDCEDGCASHGLSVACRNRACVAVARDDAPPNLLSAVGACSGLLVEPQVHARSQIRAIGQSRLQTAGERPNPYVFATLENDGPPVRIQLLAVEVMGHDSLGRSAAIPVQVDAILLGPERRAATWLEYFDVPVGSAHVEVRFVASENTPSTLPLTVRLTFRDATNSLTRTTSEIHRGFRHPVSQNFMPSPR